MYMERPIKLIKSNIDPDEETYPILKGFKNQPMPEDESRPKEFGITMCFIDSLLIAMLGPFILYEHNKEKGYHTNETARNNFNFGQFFVSANFYQVLIEQSILVRLNTLYKFKVQIIKFVIKIMTEIEK